MNHFVPYRGFPIVPLDRTDFSCGYAKPRIFDNLPPASALSSEVLDSLRVFQTNGDPLEKLKDIAFDLAHNVTHVYERDDFILAYDLVAHSVLFGRRGWVEGLVISDAECGKTKTFRALSEHYGHPLFHTQEARKTPSPIYLGRQYRKDRKWHQCWGLLPRNDRRMLVVDGPGYSWISALREPRTNLGAVTMTGVETQRTLARTRLLWSTSLRAGILCNLGPCGDIVRRVVPNRKDLEPFDFVVLASREDVSTFDIKRESRITCSHVYTAELCQALLLWAWTRTDEQVVFSGLVLDERDELVQRRIARVATAIAARLFSTPDGQMLLVTGDHFRAADTLLANWSMRGQEDGHYRPLEKDPHTMTEAEMRDSLDAIAPFGADFPKRLLRAGVVNPRSLQDLARVGQREARVALRVLVANGALRRTSWWYHLTTPFSEMLKRREVDRESLQKDRVP